MKARLLWLSLAVFACRAVAPAQETALEIDPASTRVEFTLGDVLHTVHGTFALKSGNLRLDAAGLASGELVVDAASGQSGNAMRDRRMRANVLDSEQYPEIVLRAERVEGKLAAQGPSQVILHGAMEIHGQTHPVAIPLEVAAAAGTFTAAGSFPVPYVKWGIKNPSTLFLRVSETVTITIHTVARPVTATAHR